MKKNQRIEDGGTHREKLKASLDRNGVPFSVYQEKNAYRIEIKYPDRYNTADGNAAQDSKKSHRDEQKERS